jgi:hypothetical protein
METQTKGVTGMDVFAILKDQTGMPRYMIESAIIEAAGNIIRSCDNEGLAAVSTSTSMLGDLWGAKAMADAEMSSRRLTYVMTPRGPYANFISVGEES